MSAAREFRRVALQALYQFDAGAADRIDDVRAGISEHCTDEAAMKRGFELAGRAWEQRQEADEKVAVLAPEWPTHRQPMIDRNILRLAWYEMRHGGLPWKIAITEAVELAKEFGSNDSARFVNGVLDRLARQAFPESNGEATA